MQYIFDFVVNNMKPIELFVFWYPITMGLLWVIGGLIYYYRIERRKPLPLNSTPFVSILVPAYNEGGVLNTTIKRINEIDYPNYEILIINDGSTDDTADIANRLAEQYDTVRFIDCKENCGKANALYLGFIASKGEYLICVDGDSYLDKDCVRHMMSHFLNPHNGERVGAVTGNPRVRNRSSLLAKIQLCEYASIISLIKRCQRVWGKVMTVSGVVVAYRKRALLDCGLWDRDLITEDIGVTWKLEKNFWDVRYESRAICWMLVPETIKGLFRQRRRWAQGGQEVMLRHAGIFRSWRRRRMYPIFAEQVCSLLWVCSWLLLTLTEIFRLFYDSSSYIPYLWKSQYIAIICLLQFVVAFFLEKKYDRQILRNMFVVAWYPVVYWIVNGLVSLSAIPTSIKVLFRSKKKLATWNSPDRGLGTADDKTDEDTVTDEDACTEEESDIDGSEADYGVMCEDISSGAKAERDIITGQQKNWKKIIEFVITCLCWLFILVYLFYIIYGSIALLSGNNPVSIWIYNRQVLIESYRLLKITGIILLVEILFLIFWKEYNRRRFGSLNRRTFRPDASVDDIVRFFGLTEDLINDMRNSDVYVLEHNIISEDFKSIPMKPPSRREQRQKKRLEKKYNKMLKKNK